MMPLDDDKAQHWAGKSAGISVVTRVESWVEYAATFVHDL
jgi:hypothetical protein